MTYFLKPSVLGGMIARIETAQGSLYITVTRDHDGPIFDADGKPLGTLKMVMRTPEPPPPRVLTDEQNQRIAQRRAVCDACEHQGGYGPVTVKCAKCNRCGGKLAMLAGRGLCPLGKWPSGITAKGSADNPA